MVFSELVLLFFMYVFWRMLELANYLGWTVDSV